MKTYVTFGQSHNHSINDKIFDHNCVAIVNGDRDKVFEIFGPKFCFEYPEDHWNPSYIHYYPRGYIEVNPEEPLNPKISNLAEQIREELS